jgi:hypothetical protein
VGDHGRRGVERGHPGVAVRVRAQRVGVQEVERGEVAARERGGDPGRVQPGLGQRGVARPHARMDAGLADAAAVGRRGRDQQPGAGPAGDVEVGRDVEQRLRGARGQRALAGDEHHVLPGLAQQLGEVAHDGGLRACGGGGPGEVALVARQRGVERDEQTLERARRVAHDRGGVRVQRGRARGRDGELGAVAAHALADAQVPDRRLVDRVDVQQQHAVRELEVGDRRLQLRRGQRAGEVGRQLAGRRGRQVRRAEAVAQQPLQQERLLVGGLAARDRGRLGARLLERRPGGGERLLPRGGHERAALAHQRLRDALVDVGVLERVAALVAQPAVVDLGVVAAEHAHDAVVADRQRHVALRRAQRADRAGALDVPRARAEAVGGARERAHRAQLGDVAAERRHVRAAVEGGDVRVRAALLQDQLVVLGDLLAEAHAAVAEDAALAVDRHHGRELERLAEVALGLDEAARPAAPAVGDVLQRALAALVADRAVERVVDEQELDDRLLCLLDASGLGVDDHAVLDRGRAGGLQLGDALDLDQAHAAGADGRTELGLITEDRDLDVAVLGAVDQHDVRRGGDLSTVDREGHHLHFGSRH